MTDEEQLQSVKTALGIGGTYQDSTIALYIEEVKYYLESAGISADVIASQKSIGLITRGVADLWNYGSGEARLSNYFMQRCAQLAIEASATE